MLDDPEAPRPLHNPLLLGAVVTPFISLSSIGISSPDVLLLASRERLATSSP
jgi:hypothetical protein